ncbi:cytochrome P450 [Burkholderia sp. USMB20]|uniref:cytochrome P450 n=1 Tax=Burkholderia sp. USMB20 TaxID=1571773 RepID=UPI0005CF31F5|nr:cytochrome P450 [Burkholderia sp. USMB20]TGN95687.1 cytochrome P450 [Burkholderia sp. USMB20]
MRPLSTEASSQAQGPITPASERFDPFDPRYVSDPYPTLAELRASEAVFFSPAIGSWVVTRFETVKAVLRDTERFSAKIASDPLTPLCPHARNIIADSGFDVPPMLVNNDPPSHAHYRTFFGAPLTRERLQALRPFTERTVDAYIDRLLAGTAPADLVAGLTWDVPALVLFQLLGVPADDVGRVKEWASSRVVLTWGRPTEAEQVELSNGAVAYYRYAHDLVQRKALAPQDDYLSDLLRARDGDDHKATMHEIGAIAFNLLFAGHETTSSAAINMFKAVLEDRKLWQAICQGKQPLAQVIEESFRMDPPVQAWRRQAKEDVVLDGVTIPAGDRLLLSFAAANNDPQQFPEPDTFAPGRRNVMQHVAFGVGAHFCLGAPLARMELEVMLQRVASRIPQLELVPDQSFPYTPNTSFRALQRLLVTW